VYTVNKQIKSDSTKLLGEDQD